VIYLKNCKFYIYLTQKRLKGNKRIIFIEILRTYSACRQVGNNNITQRGASTRRWCNFESETLQRFFPFITHTETAFGQMLLALKIYSTRYMRYRFSALSVCPNAARIAVGLSVWQRAFGALSENEKTKTQKDEICFHRTI